MPKPDLTPSTYIKKSRTRQALRQWSGAGLFCLLLAAAPIAIESTQGSDSSAGRAEERIALAKSRLSQTKGAILSLTVQLKQHERELQAGRHLTQRPDWSSVMRLVGAQFNEQLMMTGFQLGESSDTKVRSALGPLAQDAPDRSVWLVLTGVAESNSTVPGLIIRLEQLGLFQRVVMTGAQREAFAGGARTAFTLACRVE